LLDAVLELGASDVLRLPVSPRLLRNRAEMLLTVSRSVDLGPIPSELVRVNDVLTQHGDDAEALVAVLEVLQESLQFERASLIAYIEGSNHGFVIAATDAPTRRQFTLAMAEYPEILHAMKTCAPVLIDDVMTHPLTSRLGDMLAERGVRGSAVLPVQWRGRLLGVILLRRSTPGVGHIAGRGIELAQLVTSITAAHLRHGPVLASLREQTHRISRDRYEAERRLRGIDSLKEHFEAGTDGVVVLDNGGRILFVNRAAERITGFARDGLIGNLLTELAPFEQHAQIEDAAAQVLAGTNVAPFDLSLNTTQHNPVRVSVSTSTVLAGTGAAIFSFRDVTAERKLENELRSTKEFLERLIDSTVDAIIAADLHGTIILFNQGAERLFGFRAGDMIGKRPIWDLYDKSAARQIMRMLRSNAYGGGGRLDAIRREVKTRGGEVVPVSMSAAIIYEGDEEVATVGILTDLRERIRMEQRLAQAQRQLQLTEKQALVAELAGAAAHELNQPLTSILGYCELLKRQSPPESAHMRAVGIISGQGERMAAIVKKIGRLTKYETTDYVGTERILDLDRAADDSGLVLDPVEEGKTGEFTAVLPGGLAQALGRDDFDLPWPNSGSAAAAPGLPGLSARRESGEGDSARSAESTGEAQAMRSEPRRSGSSSHPAVRELEATGLGNLGSGNGNSSDDRMSNLGSGITSGKISSAASVPRSATSGIAEDIAAGSGPAPTSASATEPSAVPLEISERLSTSVAMVSPDEAATAAFSAVPEAELLAEETKPRGK
jgi:PAS domain S-box-containing protein